jgi:16S rRNA (guanine527-N7)-methyltransferase
LPLAIALEDTDCVGIDAIQKKISALWRIVEPMGLRNASMLCGRSEELAHKPGLRATFDVVTARAVAPLPVLLEYAIPFLNVGGIAVFWKSTKVADELASSANAQKVLHAPFVCTYDYELPSGWGKRTLVIFRKTKPTSDDYPRKVGVPKAKPL